MNKLSSALITGALLLATAVPAFAMGMGGNNYGNDYGNNNYGHNRHEKQQNTVSITNDANISNNVVSVANTGGIVSETSNQNSNNNYGRDSYGHNKDHNKNNNSQSNLDISTGVANSDASAFVGDTGGINVTNNLPSKGKVTVHNTANISNNVWSVANTGLVFTNSKGGSTTISTGDANSQAQAVVENVNVTGF